MTEYTGEFFDGLAVLVVFKALLPAQYYKPSWIRVGGGGYPRTLLRGPRQGDAADMSLIELVD